MGERVKVEAKKTEVKRNNVNSQMWRSENSRSMDTGIDRILYLQRTAGNRAVSRLMRSGFLQVKLRIGQPRDVYEQEAKVMPLTSATGKLPPSVGKTFLRTIDYPIVQRYSPPTGKTDPNAIIPIVDFIGYVKAVEKGYPSDTPTDIVSRIRVQYYSGMAFKQLIPDAHLTDYVESIDPGDMLMSGDMPMSFPRKLSKRVIGGKAFKHLTARADENATGDNPSPYVQLASGERIDVGHLLLGLDALIHPRTATPFTDYSVPNIDPASWVADLGIASVWMSQHEKSESAPDDAPKKLSKPDLDEYYKMSAPEEDLLGDVDSFGVHQQWVAKSGQTLSQVLSAYYLGKLGKPATAVKRWQTFCTKNGFAYTRSGNSITWAAHLKPSLVIRIDTFNNLFASGKWGAAWAITLGSPKKRTWPHTPKVVDKFLAFIKTRLEAELTSGKP